MFENEISSYAFNITKRYTGDRVKLSTLLSDVDLPEDFKKFAEAEVEEMIEAEHLGESRTGKFDFSGPDIQALFKEVRHVMKNSYEFSREEFLELAEKASKFVFNYIIRPRWTLEKFLFKGDQQVTRSSIARSSRYFSAYSYYPRGIIEYLDFHKKDSLDIETWRKLHAKIDEHLLSTIPAKLNSLTWSLFKLFEFASGADKVPSDAMVLFFRDKSATDIVDRIEFVRDVKNLRALDVMSLVRVLEAESSDVSRNIAVLPQNEEPPKEFRSFDRQKVTHPLHPEVPPAEPLPEIPSEQPPVKETPLPPRPETGRKPPVESLLTKADPKQKTQTSIRNFLPAKIEDKIVKKIFRGSRSGYQVAIHRLDESQDWPSASKIVEGIFIDNEVDPFSKYAVAFTDAVSARFRKAPSAG